MITNLLNLGKIKYLISIIFIIVLSSCNVTDILDGNKEKDQNNDSIEIGVDGGTITVDDVTITIPAGAFTQTANIKVTQTGSDNTGEDIVTPIYSIEGLPNNYSLPIDVTIKLSGATNNETYLVVQDEAFVSSLNSVNKSNIYFRASISGNSLKGQIPALQSGLAKTSSDNTGVGRNSPSGLFSLHIFGTSNKKTYTSANNHFKITYNASKDNITNITSLGQYLEVAYGKIKEMGFDFSKRTNWPVSVTITELGNAHGLFTPSKWSINNGYIMFDRTGLGEQLQVKTSAIHEFFHLVQYLYDSRGAFRQGISAPDHYWFNEACSTWSEGLVASSDYEPNNWIANQLRPFNGLQAGSLDDPEKHGYGMSSFIKYLVGKYGKSVLVEIYEKLLAKRHVIDAINNSTNYNLFLDCNRFFKRYSQGLIYTSFGPGTFAQITEDEFDIKSAADTLKNFAANYKDLSAKVYLVKLQNPEFQIDDTLEFSIDQNLCDITVFKYPSLGNSSIVAEGQKICAIPGIEIKDLYQQHKQLYVMVTNSNFISNNYRPSNLDINLKIKLLSHKLKAISVRLKLADYQYRFCDSTGCEDRTSYFSDPAFYFSSGLYDGVWNMNNNVFTGKIDNPSPDNQTVNGTMTITFLDNPLRVNVVIDADWAYTSSSIERWTRHYHLEINDVPGSYDSYYQAGPSLSRMNFVYKENYNSPTTWFSKEYLNSSFNYESEIYVTLFK